ncbi:hypothetical protein CBR_g8538 [Chara braunii]|uniref:Uncharacterized protein n=1 Tax=Chara braunii TaxID=69332 RepID=A0A388KMH7_CHABU|nr:hypothetical protein CBR_g8538 [Chara braunii]|eukprot:GBG71235.1 hypothetical protein CBR_g8538 [Chara braunii]
MAQDPIEAESWSDPDDLAVESEPGDSDDGRDDGPLAEMLRPRTRAFTTTAAPRPPPPPPLPSSAPASTAAAAQHPPPPTDRPGHGEQGTREIVDEGDDDDDDDDDRQGYEGKSEDEDDLRYSPRRGRGDDDDDGGDGTQAAGGLRTSVRQRADRCSGANRGGSGAGRGGGGARHTGGAGRGGGGRARRESASSTRTVHWVDEEAAPSATEFAVASEEVTGGFAEVVGEAAQVRRASAQLGASFSGILDVSLGLPPTPAGERGIGVADASATPVSQILRDIPECSMGDISSSMLQEATEGTQGSSGQQERAVGNDGDCRPVQERAPESECGSAGCGDAGERPASPVQGVCILPIGGAMTAGELERQAREDPLQADRRGRMDEAPRRLVAEGPAYVVKR